MKPSNYSHHLCLCLPPPPPRSNLLFLDFQIIPIDIRVLSESGCTCRCSRMYVRKLLLYKTADINGGVAKQER